MFCVIQTLQRKKGNPYGEYRKYEVQSTGIQFPDGTSKTHYSYYPDYEAGRFERPRREAYHEAIISYIQGVRGACTQYDTTLQGLERYKGSAAYDQEARAAEAKRDNAASALRDSFWRDIREATAAMREAAKNRPLVPPTPEQAALLNVLQMRKTISRDELNRAARQLEGCPVALAVLGDLAEKNGVHGLQYEREWALADVLDKIDTLETSARKLLQAGLAAADRRVPEDITYCLFSYGCFNPVSREGVDTTGGVRSEDLVPPKAEIAAFCAAVDG